IDVVSGNADERCSERRELRVGLGELVRFDGAAFGKRGRKEVEYDRTFLLGLGQRKPVHFSAQRSGSSEVRRVLPDVQGGIRRAGQDEREYGTGEAAFHGDLQSNTSTHSIPADVPGGAPTARDLARA